jgi:endoglucanase
VGRAKIVTAVAAVLSPLVFGLTVPALLPMTTGSGRVSASGGRAPALMRATAPSPRGAKLWVSPFTPAALAVPQARLTRPGDALLLRKIAARPHSTWLGEWLTPADAQTVVARRTAAAAKTGAVPVFVLYAIPARDCGSYSAGGTGSPARYRAWVDGVSRGLAGRTAIVVVEPDALPQLDCLSPANQKTRLGLLSYAVDSLRRNPGVSIYLDAGNAHWKQPTVIAARLRAAGVNRVRGFSVNAGNFDTTASEIAFAKKVSIALGGAVPFVVDTSRNGKGRWTGPENWCNPPGRGLGAVPTTNHADPLVDALLWIKTPGLSDGTCKGGPPAGRWWQSYAVGLARNASW